MDKPSRDPSSHPASSRRDSTPSQPADTSAQLGETTGPEEPASQPLAPEAVQDTHKMAGAQHSTVSPPGGQASQPAGAKPKLTTLGDFRLVGKLGEGGMGTVFKAQQISLDRELAIKVLGKHLADNPDFVQRFQREARL